MKVCGAVLLVVLLLGLAKLWKKKTFLLLLAASGICLAAAVLTETVQEGQEITAIPKSENGSGTIQKELLAKVEEAKIELTVTVPEKRYTPREAQEILEAEKTVLPERILGENTDFSHVCTNLALPETGTRPEVRIEWYSSDPEVFSWDGRIGDAVPETGERIRLSAVLMLQEEKADFVREITVFPPPPGDLKEKLEKEIRAENTQTESDSYVLPDEVHGKAVLWYERPERKAAYLAVLILVAGILAAVSERQKAENRRKERQEKLRSAYPELVSKLLLFLYSGISMRKALLRIAAGYQKKKKENSRYARNEAFEEVVLLCREIDNGVLETQAFEHMAERCALPPYRTLSVLMTQNQKRGGAGILEKLEQETANAFGEKKHRARVAGDAASLKLLLPLGLMLLVAFALMMVPAFLSL